MRLRIALLAITAFLLAACTGQSGADGPAASITSIPDQAALDTLVAAAQDEGQVVWYTSIPSERAEQIAEMFKTEYSVEVLVQRSGGEDILQRFLLEKEAGRIQNDVLTISDPATFISLEREGALTCFVPRNFDSVPAYAKDANGCWVATRTNAMVMAYNTQQITDPPTGWADLLDPRFAGKLAYINPDFSSGALIVTAGLANDQGWEWFERFAKNEPFVVKSNNQLMETIVIGERGIGTFVNSTYVSEAKAAGQPIEWVFPKDGVYLIPAPSAVVSGAPHPAAGKLLADFLLTDAVQQLMIDDGNYAAVQHLSTPAGQPKIEEMTRLDIDYQKLTESVDGVRDRFNTIIGAAN